MRLVVDGSTIVAVCLADGRLGPLAGHALYAPALLPAEAASSIREQRFRAEISASVAADAIRHLQALAVAYSPPAGLTDAAYRLAEENGWAKTYDAEYVALARTLGCPLVTLDGRLQRGAAHLATILAPVDLPPAG